jgi:hypothetical protein
MGLIFDSSFVIDSEREAKRKQATGPARTFLKQHHDEEVFITFTIAGELACGRSASDRATWERLCCPYRGEKFSSRTFSTAGGECSVVPDSECRTFPCSSGTRKFIPPRSAPRRLRGEPIPKSVKSAKSVVKTFAALCLLLNPP